MREFTIKEVLDAACGQLLIGSGKERVRKVCTDSRKAEEGDLFFALIGENNDAHDYLRQVFERGCRAAVISDANKLAKEGLAAADARSAVILVSDTTKALQDLAAYYLESLPLKHRIAVTGSVGKTSTRDMMYYIASTKYKTGRNLKNFNNGIGLPLSILEFDEDTQAAVLEMGMDNFGQIEKLARIVHPDIALITNIGISHIENLGSREGILRAKMEVTTCFDENSTLVVNSDCDMLSRENVSGKHTLVTVGSAPENEYIVSNVRDLGDRGIEYSLTHDGKKYDIKLAVPGAHNALNASLAIAAAERMGIEIPEAIEGLADAKLTEKRLNIKENNGIKVIDDTYNACPASVMSAIDTLMHTRGQRKIAIIGDMYELGAEAESAHEAVGRYAQEKPLDLLIAVGKLAKGYAKGAREKLPEDRVLYFEEKSELLAKIGDLLAAGDVVLVKASRGMMMEEIVNEILRDKYTTIGDGTK